MQAAVWLSGSLYIFALLSDLSTRKVQNTYVLLSAILALATNYFFLPNTGLLEAMFSCFLVFLIGFPLSHFKMIGAGDIKFLMAMSLMMTPSFLAKFVVWSLLWAALFGATKYLLSKDNKFPFTFAYFMAWLSLHFLPNGGLL